MPRDGVGTSAVLVPLCRPHLPTLNRAIIGMCHKARPTNHSTPNYVCLCVLKVDTSRRMALRSFPLTSEPLQPQSTAEIRQQPR